MNSFNLVLLSIVAFVFCVSGDCSFYVSPYGSDGNDGKTYSKPFKTIGRALYIDDDITMGYRTVCVLSGTYPSEGNSNMEFRDEGLALLALDGQGTTQIDLDPEDLFLFYYGPSFQMTNFSFKGGNQILDVALTTTNNVSFQMDSCFINQTVSTSPEGGPILVTSPPIGVAGTANIVFRHCQMSFTETKNASLGGGAVTLSLKRPSSVLFEDCVFNNNEASNNGGALSISLLSSTASSPPVPSNLTMKCSFSEGVKFGQKNQAGGKGGFLYYNPIYDSGEGDDDNYILVENCQIGNNTAGGGGGGMWIQNANVDIQGGKFYYNSGGKGNGGGIYMEGNLNLSPESSSVLGPSFLGNTAGEGAAFFLENYSSDLMFSSLNLGENTCLNQEGGEIVIWPSFIRNNNNTVGFSNITFSDHSRITEFAIILGNNTQAIFQDLNVDPTSKKAIFPSLFVGPEGQVLFENTKDTPGLVIDYLVLSPSSTLSSGGIPLIIGNNFEWFGGMIDGGATPSSLTIDKQAEMTLKEGESKCILKNLNLKITGKVSLSNNIRLLFEGGTSLDIAASGTLNLGNNTSIAPSSSSPPVSFSLAGTLSSFYSSLYGNLTQNGGQIAIQKDSFSLSSVLNVNGSACLNGTTEMNYVDRVQQGDYGLISYESLICEPRIVIINNFNGKYLPKETTSLLLVSVLQTESWKLGGVAIASLVTLGILFFLFVSGLIVIFITKRKNKNNSSLQYTTIG